MNDAPDDPFKALQQPGFFVVCERTDAGTWARYNAPQTTRGDADMTWKSLMTRVGYDRVALIGRDGQRVKLARPRAVKS